MSDQHLAQLEELRQRLEALERKIGRTHDYLDRGHPDQEQSLRAWREIKTWQEQTGPLKEALTALVTELRAAEPALLVRWVERHQELYRQVQTRYQGGPEAKKVPDPDLALYIARKAQEEWAGVLRGKRDYLLANAYLMDHHRDLSRQLLDFSSSP